MTRINTVAPLDPALTHFVGVDHGAGPDETKCAVVHVDPDGRVVIIGDGGSLVRRIEIARTLINRSAMSLPSADPLLAPIPPAALAAFDVPGNHKKNRAARRKEARRGR